MCSPCKAKGREGTKCSDKTEGGEGTTRMNEMAPCVCLRVRVRRRGPFPKSWPSPNSWQFRGCGYVAPVAAVALFVAGFALLALLVLWLLSLPWLFFSLALLVLWLLSLHGSFVAGFALYEHSRTSWGWDQRCQMRVLPNLCLSLTGLPKPDGLKLRG